MRDPIELTVDVTDAVALGFPAQTVATVHLPEPEALVDPPVVCFAFPGGGYSRRYFAMDLPGDDGGQARWHVDRGWIFVACDHLGFGDATVPEVDVLDFDNVALGNRETVDTVMRQLESGALEPGYPPVVGATKLGIGQSMGGCFTIVLQGHHRSFDGIATLGYSGIHTVVPSRPGAPPAVWPWIPRGSDLDAPEVLNADAIAAAAGPALDGAESLSEAAAAGEHPFAWSFHYDDVPADLVALDMAASAGTLDGPLPPWRSANTPRCGLYMVAPGAVAIEAASITVPVLSATGERDVVPTPRMEPLAFTRSSDVTVFVCPRMGHMHNFAGTRRRFWDRIHSWGSGVAAQRAIGL